MDIYGNKSMYITFQPLRSLENINNRITSDNKFLFDYRKLLGFTPLFCNSLEGNPIEFIISDILLSFPRNPEVAIVFEKSAEEVKKVSRLEVFGFDNLLDSSENENNSSLHWNSMDRSNVDIVDYINIDNPVDSLNDYLVNGIDLNEIKGIYLICKDGNEIMYDNLYKYNHMEFIQWVIESLSETLVDLDIISNRSKKPEVDTTISEFVDVYNTIYNQFIYKPDVLSELEILKYENLLESWIFGEVSAESKDKLDKIADIQNGTKINIDTLVDLDDLDLNQYNSYLRTNYINDSQGLINKVGFVGSDIKPFGYIEDNWGLIGV